MKKWQIALTTAILCLVLILIMYSYNKNTSSQNGLITDDGFNIAYDYHYVSPQGVILVHMMGGSKSDYNALAKFLNDNGYSTISIDLRGHGKSTGDTKTFSDEDFQNMKYDLKTAKNFLVKNGVNKIGIIGASIGANLALNYAASSDIKRIIMLSPGEDYRSIKTVEIIPNYKGSVLLTASKDDPYSYNTAQKLDTLASGTHKFVSFDSGGHGTNMLNAHPELQQTILDFLNTT
jgi:esterase/lipase